VPLSDRRPWQRRAGLPLGFVDGFGYDAPLMSSRAADDDPRNRDDASAGN
jgi:hypothetical protein